MTKGSCEKIWRILINEAKAEEAEVRRVTEIATERARSDEAIRREVVLARKDQE